MANLTQKYHSYTIPGYGVNLKRFYIGSSPDEVGTVAFWQNLIAQLYNQLPFPSFWTGLNLEIWHMDSPDLVSHDKATLLDYDPATPGYQTAVGLTFGTQKICLGVFPDGWKPEPHALVPVTQANVDYTGLAISHEFGHYLQSACNYYGTSKIHEALRQFWTTNRPHQTDNQGEDWAESVRAIMGTDIVRGTFSDNKIYKPAPAVVTFLKTCYWLGVNLSGKNVTDFTVKDSYVQWREWQWYSLTDYALTASWELFRWTISGWKKV